MKRLIFTLFFIAAFVACDSLDSPELNDGNHQNDAPELPNLVAVDFIDGWTETRFSKDGLISFLRMASNNKLTDVMMYIPDKTYGVLPLFARFNENEIPTFITWGDTETYIEYNEDGTINITMAVAEAVYRVENQQCDNLVPSIDTKAWGDNNAIRNICAVGETVIGASSVLGGVMLIGASGISEIASYGASTPLSIPGISLGIIGIKSGCDAIKNGLDTMFGPVDISEQDNYYVESLLGIGQEAICSWIEDAPDNKFVQKFIPPELLKNVKDLGKMGTIQYWGTFGFATLDKLCGRSYNKEYELAKIHNSISVYVNPANVEGCSVALSGFVSPEATEPLGKKISTEIAMVLEESGNKTHKSILDGNGGNVTFVFDNLKPGTTYNYYLIFHDRENGFSRSSKVMSFTTSTLPAIQSMSHKDNYIYKNNQVMYEVTVSISNPSLPEGTIEYGIYFIHPETGNRHKYNMTDKGQFGSEISFPFWVDRELYSMVGTFDARSEIKIGLYFITTAGETIVGETKKMTFTYNKIPSVKFTSVHYENIDHGLEPYEDPRYPELDMVISYCIWSYNVKFEISNAAFYRPDLYYKSTMPSDDNYTSEGILIEDFDSDSTYSISEDSEKLYGICWNGWHSPIIRFYLKFKDGTEIHSTNGVQFYHTDSELIYKIVE